MEEKVQEGVFLNGKQKILDMYHILSPQEKATLIKNLRPRNPALANELIENALTFDDLNRLSDQQISTIFNYVTAPILGVALKGCREGFQRRVLGLAPRNYAEESYNALMARVSNEKTATSRARQKIVDLLISLNKQKILQL